jgi:hypothetical protein
LLKLFYSHKIKYHTIFDFEPFHNKLIVEFEGSVQGTCKVHF